MKRLELKEPPREGRPERARYLLRCGELNEVVGWTNSRKEALDWKRGFGPGALVTIEDQLRHEFVGVNV